MSAEPKSHDWTFLKRFLARPWKVASPIPSGRRLATRVAGQIDPKAGALVLELGPGTGAVTRALLARGVREEDLVLIESDPDFVRLLRAQFPRTEVIEGDAFAFADLLGARAFGMAGVVSGLPVVSETTERKRRFVDAALDALAAGRPFVQFTYSPRLPLPQPEGVEAHCVAEVRENVWPMRIWVYRRRGAPNG